MKLKEKLADEFVSLSWNLIEVPISEDLWIDKKALVVTADELMRSSYLAGFDAAREKFKESMFRRMQDKSLDWQTLTDVMWVDLQRLGEEDV